MGARDHGGGNVFTRQARAEREAAADGLGHRDDVGGDVGPFMGEEAPGAPEAALDFVEHEQQPMFVAEAPQALQELDAHGGDAALALDGLDEDGAGLRPDQRLDGLEVAGAVCLKPGMGGPKPSR